MNKRAKSSDNDMEEDSKLNLGRQSEYPYGFKFEQISHFLSKEDADILDDNNNEIIMFIKFPLVSGREHLWTINFPEYVTPGYALKTVENFLNIKVTHEYNNMVNESGNYNDYAIGIRADYLGEDIVFEGFKIKSHVMEIHIA